ncbi:uncharacterized protein BYT42DRAFT_609898 [Radiomyces spectabilis]|uniref:uncharacterized protein n=1 Tax=Radiomyces spectabilis TaxID=64574 RepID=UPI00221F752F|nr:uncharacterized protein BYT42DRAFT_609898 [Radiomyces spectabilis]KAI8394162.1 hypothetical protein BYT42DRAFT_609898 [Radiomyces spectabilis]
MHARQDCPALAPRRDPPKSVRDLRTDDIEVIAAIGDSITSGFASVNVDTPYFSPDQLREFRGLSWLMGGESNAVSIVNFLRPYSPNIVGASMGVKESSIFINSNGTVGTTGFKHNPETDNLNAALPLATSRDFMNQVDYLVERIGKGTALGDKWKLINVFMGFNDLALSCMPGWDSQGYEANVKAGLQKLQQNVDKAFVNLIGLFHFEEFVYITDKEPGYRKHLQNSTIDTRDYECGCCKKPGGIETIKRQVDLYNAALQRIANRYNPRVRPLLTTKLDAALGYNNLASDTFIVRFQPFDINPNSVPPDALSNIDGYHPNLKGLAFMTKLLWEDMFQPLVRKQRVANFREDYPVYCPTNDDRLNTR